MAYRGNPIPSTGERAALRERLDAFEAAGYSQFTVQLIEGHEDAIEDWAELFFG